MPSVGRGDFVEYIGPGLKPGTPARGTVRRCEAVLRPEPCLRCKTVRAGLVIHDTPAPDGCIAWCACVWRPVYRPNASLITRLAQLIDNSAMARNAVSHSKT